jgi:hypothetical protein
VKNYRIFVTRHYIDVLFFDVKADKPYKAKRMAEKAARKVRPNSRDVATDNGWIADEPATLQRIGQNRTSHIFKTREIMPNVFQDITSIKEE